MISIRLKQCRCWLPLIHCDSYRGLQSFGYILMPIVFFLYFAVNSFRTRIAGLFNILSLCFRASFFLLTFSGTDEVPYSWKRDVQGFLFFLHPLKAVYAVHSIIPRFSCRYSVCADNFTQNNVPSTYFYSQADWRMTVTGTELRNRVVTDSAIFIHPRRQGIICLFTRISFGNLEVHYFTKRKP